MYIHTSTIMYTLTLRDSKDSKANKSWPLSKPHYYFPEQLCAQTNAAL